MLAFTNARRQVFEKYRNPMMHEVIFIVLSFSRMFLFYYNIQKHYLKRLISNEHLSNLWKILSMKRRQQNLIVNTLQRDWFT